MGENRETLSFMRALLIRASVSVPSFSTGASVLAATLAPREIKKDKKIHRATEARAEVAMFLNKMEKRMAIPSQNEI